MTDFGAVEQLAWKPAFSFCDVPKNLFLAFRENFGTLSDTMNSREISNTVERELITLFEELRSGIAAREDSRAFGASIERRILDNWDAICQRSGFTPVALPGPRTIFDFGFSVEDHIVGIDVKTKDLDTTKYSDGGICAVGNLLKFLANDKGQFLIAEFGHYKSAEKTEARDLEYIRVAPFILLPQSSYRIENLGTGQVRLNYTINQVWDEIEWDRPVSQFYDIFTDLAIKHYQRCDSDSGGRKMAGVVRHRAGGRLCGRR